MKTCDYCGRAGVETLAACPDCGTELIVPQPYVTAYRVRIPGFKICGAWLVMIIGLLLTALPLYAELFTKELVEVPVYNPQPDPVGVELVEDGFSITTRVSFRLMYVSPWVPLLGGVLTLSGGFLVGRAWSLLPGNLSSDLADRSATDQRRAS